MNKIEKKIYDTVITPENFKIFFDINQRFDDIIEQLKAHFLKELQKTFTNIIPQIKCTESEIDAITFSTKDKSNYFTFEYSYDESYMELKVYSKEFQSKKAAKEEFREITEMRDALSNLGFDGDVDDKSFYFQKTIIEDFEDLKDCLKLIPTEREELISQLETEMKEILKQVILCSPKIELENIN